MIHKRRNKEDKPDFEYMMNEVEEDIEGQQIEQSIVGRVPELKQLNENIEKATTLLVNAMLLHETSVHDYRREEVRLNGIVADISRKVDSINDTINKLVKDAHDNLKVSVKVSDADWKKIQDTFDKEHTLQTQREQKHIREVDDMFIAERKRSRARYKEYDGTYLGHYAQWFFWFFFSMGLMIFGSVIIMTIGKHFHWF
ncbi:MAG: hypothetical protein Q4D41_00355 [Prevotellaceae bacterium]|nr:hypothetical protein [Prevotellaceae bacterium]